MVTSLKYREIRPFSAVVTGAADYDIGLVCFKAPGELNFRYNYMVQAVGGITMITDKMNMIIQMVTTGTVILAKGVENCIICSRDRMDDPLFHKCLQGAVDRNPVKLFSAKLFNISMGQCGTALMKQFQDFFAAFGNTELLVF